MGLRVETEVRPGRATTGLRVGKAAVAKERDVALSIERADVSTSSATNPGLVRMTALLIGDVSAVADASRQRDDDDSQSGIPFAKHRRSHFERWIGGHVAIEG
jgi:hypothetical protein